MREPDDDLIEQTLTEMLDEARSSPTILQFPEEVIHAIEAYEKAHSLPSDLFVEAMDRRMRDPEAFDWPIDDPLLCVSIAFAWEHAMRWTDKVSEKYGLDVDEDEPADWWKATD